MIITCRTTRIKRTNALKSEQDPETYYLCLPAGKLEIAAGTRHCPALGNVNVTADCEITIANIYPVFLDI